METLARHLRICFWRLRGLLFKRRLEQEMEEEVLFHLRMRSAMNISGGADPAAAKREAIRTFGKIDVIKDYCRDINGGGSLETLISDLHYTFRSLRNTPGFAMVAIIILALGIGATSSMFSVVKSVLIRSLPFKDPGRLVQIEVTARSRAEQSAWVDYADAIDFRDRSNTLDSVGMQRFALENLISQDRPEALYGASVSSDLFPTLGVEPIIGRNFYEYEDEPDRNHQMILSYEMWQRLFGGDPGVIGREISFADSNGKGDAEGFVVVGVMPAGFNFPLDIPSQVNLDTRQMAFWVPLGLGRTAPSRPLRPCRVTARLKAGVSLDQAQVDLDRVAGQLEQEYPNTNTGRGVKLVPLKDHIFGDSRPAMILLLGATGLVLLIACANIANLLIVRGALRTRETAIRIAIGAGRARVIRQLVTEGLLLSTIGGTAGIVLAKLTLGAVIRLAPQDVPRLADTKIDAAVLCFALALSFICGLIFSLVPAFQASRTTVFEALKQSGPSGTLGRSQSRIRDLLVAGEVALAVVLTIGAGLLTTSFLRLMAVDTGYQAGHVFAALVIPLSRYADSKSRVRFFDQIIDNVKALPGVEFAGAVDGVPMGGNTSGVYVSIDGRQADQVGDNRPVCEVFGATPDYLRAMSVPLLAGRYLTKEDGTNGLHPILINAEAARDFWPETDPIGRRIGYNDFFGHETAHTVVGIVQNTRDKALDRPSVPAAFVPAEDGLSAPNFLVARADGPPSYLNDAVRRAVAMVDKDQPVFVETTMQNLVNDSVAGRRFATLMLAAFSALAFVLSSIGVYGLVSYSVVAQVRELGIRSALGAGRARLLLLVLGRGLRLTVAGVLVGGVAAFGVTRLLSSLLFEIRPTDPIVFTSVCLTFLIVSALACVVPARRASAIDPTEVLRLE